MKQVIYVGTFHPWSDKNEDDLYEALEMFDKVIIAVNKLSNKPLKGQPSKILETQFNDRIKFVYFDKLKDVLNHFKSNKYVMFDRR